MAGARSRNMSAGDSHWAIAVEEHVMLREDGANDMASVTERLGLDRMVISPGGTGVQAMTDPDAAVNAAREANDAMARIVREAPGRLVALATLPMQDPERASDELRRAVLDLGFRGALVNGFSNLDDDLAARYYDGPEYDRFWSCVESLGVPFYLHPRDPLPSQQVAYADHPELLGATWAFGAETAIHALRLITGGVFDRHPSLQIILGHLGETLPFAITRAASRMRPSAVSLERRVDEYFRDQFVLTTSGHFDTLALELALVLMGEDRVMLALDHPFADADEGMRWFTSLNLPNATMRAIGRENAERVFGVNSPPEPATQARPHG